MCVYMFKYFYNECFLFFFLYNNYSYMLLYSIRKEIYEKNYIIIVYSYIENVFYYLFIFKFYLNLYLRFKFFDSKKEDLEIFENIGWNFEF